MAFDRRKELKLIDVARPHGIIEGLKQEAPSCSHHFRNGGMTFEQRRYQRASDGVELPLRCSPPCRCGMIRNPSYPPREMEQALRQRILAGVRHVPVLIRLLILRVCGQAIQTEHCTPELRSG